MVIGAINSTGWSQLMDGNLIGAVFTMYDSAGGPTGLFEPVLAGWTVAILFFVYQFMLWIKTRNLALSFITGIFFASMYAGSIIMKPISIQIIAVLLIFEAGAILYMLIAK